MTANQQCPFYGFYPVHHHDYSNFLYENKSNQCSLIKGAHSPCQMEMRNETPCWKRCSLNSQENETRVLELLAEGIVLKSDSHISFKQHYESTEGAYPLTN